MWTRDLSRANRTYFSSRVDFNVPRSKTTGEITNDVRIQAGVPTIKYLVEQGAAVWPTLGHFPFHQAGNEHFPT